MSKPGVAQGAALVAVGLEDSNRSEAMLDASLACTQGSREVCPLPGCKAAHSPGVKCLWTVCG